MATRCSLEPLTPGAFGQFGQVFEAANCTEAPQDAAQLAHGRGGSEPRLLLLRVLPKPLPLVVRRLERHPYSSQSFIPLDGGSYLVIVASSRPDGMPDTSGVCAFVAARTQIVTLNPGTWHFEATAFGKDMRFAVIMWCESPKLDTQIVEIEEVAIG
jgi:ureidoglycolate lyase